MGIDHDALANDLQHEGAEAFTRSWEDLLAHLDAKGAELASARSAPRR